MSPPIAIVPKRTIAEQIEREIACGILRGERPPGTQLPPVRALALQFEVTVPTIQRALDRLASNGLVTAKRGSGITVNDPAQTDLSLVPLWFEALADQPIRAAHILRDFLALRRVLTAHLLQTATVQLQQAVPEMAGLAMTLHTSTDLREIAIADAALTRVVVDHVGNFALRAVFTTVERLALEVPHVAEALYGDRETHRAVIAQVIVSFAGGTELSERIDAIDAAFEAWDAISVQRFQDALATAVPAG